MGTDSSRSQRDRGRAPAQPPGGAGRRAGQGGTRVPHGAAAAAVAARARPGPRGECGGSRGAGRRGYGGSLGGAGVTRTVGCRARGQPLWRLRAISGTREVSSLGPRLGRSGTPRPSPGSAAAGKMSPAAMRNGDPCRRPGRLSPYPSWLYDLHLVTAPHSKAQSDRPGSGVGVAIHCPYRRGAWEGASRAQAMERTPPPNVITVPVWSLHTNLWAQMSTLL